MKSRIGEIHKTTEGYNIEIIEYFGHRNCTVKFNDGIILKNKRYEFIKNGIVPNPYHKTLYNIGFIGQGKYVSRIKSKVTKEYSIWSGMMQRCYNNNYHQEKPTYINCNVCDEWHNFQIFSEWLNNNYIKGFDLDKDVLVKGNKIYSPNTCCFVPKEINCLLIKNDSNRGKYPIGVWYNKDKNRFNASMNKNGKVTILGSFKTKEEAFNKYKFEKELYIKEIADKYKSQIPKKTYQAMINYKVETND